MDNTLASRPRAARSNPFGFAQSRKPSCSWPVRRSKWKQATFHEPDALPYALGVRRQGGKGGATPLWQEGTSLQTESGVAVRPSSPRTLPPHSKTRARLSVHGFKDRNCICGNSLSMTPWRNRPRERPPSLAQPEKAARSGGRQRDGTVRGAGDGGPGRRRQAGAGFEHVIRPGRGPGNYHVGPRHRQAQHGIQ